MWYNSSVGEHNIWYLGGVAERGEQQPHFRSRMAALLQIQRVVAAVVVALGSGIELVVVQVVVVAALAAAVLYAVRPSAYCVFVHPHPHA